MDKSVERAVQHVVKYRIHIHCFCSFRYWLPKSKYKIVFVLLKVEKLKTKRQIVAGAEQMTVLNSSAACFSLGSMVLTVEMRFLMFSALPR